MLFRRPSRASSEIDDAVLTLSKPEAARIEWTLDRRPVQRYFVLIVILLLALSVRLAYLNLWKGAYYEEMARHNSLRSILLAAPRGIIADRFGEPLVKNVPSLDVIVIPTLLPENPEEANHILDEVERLFHPESAVWRTTIREKTFLPNEAILVKEDLTQEEAIVYYGRASELRGVGIQKAARREYVNGSIFSHVVGYEGKIQPEELAASPEYNLTDSIGKQGVEKTYDALLRGVHGAEVVEVDSLGRIKKELGVIEPTAGRDLKLTIDKALSEHLYTAMEEWFMAHGLSTGAAIALDPRDGAVRALVSYPGYDNNLFSGGIRSEDYQRLISDSRKPLFNRAVAGEYPPGSTIKPVVAAAALSEHIITPETMIESRGGISVGNFFFGDWKAHGFTDLRRAIAVSSDVYFYTLGGGYGSRGGLGMTRMKRYEEGFGYGAQTGIDLPSEADGFLPDPEWKQQRMGERWYIGDDYHAAIGQGFITATPLQIANTIAAIANGGTLFTPHVSTASPVSSHLVPATRETLQIIREGMRQTVTEGTAQMLQTLPVAVAGKTGTAQYGNQDKTLGWFVSFAPYEHPELVLLVLVEGQPEESTYHAVPITNKVYEWYFSHESRL